MTDDNISAWTLFQACSSGRLDITQRLLQNKAYAAKALETEEHIYLEAEGHKHCHLNLDIMFTKACSSGSPT